MKNTVTVNENLTNLVHNIAGELASLYIAYLAKESMGYGLSYAYFKENWHREYNSRVNVMTKKIDMIEVLNGYNEFYKKKIAQSGDVKRSFYYQ